MLDYLFKRPMLLGGIITVVSAFALIYLRISAFLIGISIALAIGFLIIKKSEKLIAAVLVFMVFISMFIGSLKAERLMNTNIKEENCLFAVCDITVENEDYSFAEVEVIKSERLEKGTKLSVIYDYRGLSMGDIIEANIITSPLKQNSYRNIYYSKGIFLSASLEEVIKTDERDFILSFVGRTRKYIENSFFRNMGYDEAATFSALIFGEKDFFTNEFNDNIKRAGVSHVMVVSGMHLAIFVSFFLKLTKGIFYNRYIRAITMILTVIFMIALCGFSLSMLRAGVTYILIALSLCLKRESTSENTLSAAVMIILAISPFAILNIGFQLSVLATFGILVIAVPIINSLKEIFENKIIMGLVACAITSISAMITCLPVLIYAFSSVSLVGVITNLLVSSAVTIALSLGIIGLMVGLVSPAISGGVLYIASFVIKYINMCINKMGSLPFAMIEVPRWTALIAVAIILGVFWFMLSCKVRNNMLKLKIREEKIIREGGRTLKWR